MDYWGEGWGKGRVILHLLTHSHPLNTDNVQILIFNSDLGLNKYGSGFPFEKKFAHLCSILSMFLMLKCASLVSTDIFSCPSERKFAFA